MSYEIMAQEEPNDECVGMGHGAAHATQYTIALGLGLGLGLGARG